MNTQDERKAFEEWAKNASNGFASFTRFPNGNYATDKLNFAWAAWQESNKKLEGCVVVPVKTPDQFTSKLEDHLLELWIGDWGCDWDGFVSVNGIKPENIWSMVVEAARGGKDGL
ncbi:hypothetical protein [Acinetobacter modestus]|uniref:hypothetical protein n=1 Tax=Acinetobacter modestus TaxID=1776740 RepID=UPI00320B14F0